jgi:hypothetical protein
MEIADPRLRLFDRLLNLPRTEATKISDLVDKHLDDVERVLQNQALGGIVEEIVKESIEKEAHLQVSRTGVGSDFLLTQELTPDDVGSFKIGRNEELGFLLEVKSTFGERVRMSIAQARKSVHAGERYLLCVVDLRGLQRLDRIFTTPSDSELRLEVRGRMRFVLRIGERVGEIVLRENELRRQEAKIAVASGTSGVEPDYEAGKLGLRILYPVWSQGISLSDVARHCKEQLEAQSGSVSLSTPQPSPAQS